MNHTELDEKFLNAKLIHAMLFSPKSLIVTNYSDIAKFDNLVSLCAMYEVNRLDLNEVYNEDTLEAYFSVPEDYHTGEQKRTLFVFTNPTLDFLQIITGHTEIKYLVVLNSDKSISESDAVKSAKNVLLYSSKTGIFTPDMEVDTWDSDLIKRIQEQSGLEDIAKKIDELYRMATLLYTSFASGKNNEVRDILAKFTPTLRKITVPKLEQFIAAYYGVDIALAGNGARIRTPLESDKNDVVTRGEKEKEIEPKKEIKTPAKKKSSKKSNGAKGNSDIIAPALEYNDSLDPLLAEQQADLISQIREIEENEKQSKSNIVPKEQSIKESPKQPIPIPESKLHPPPNLQNNENQNNNTATHPLAGLHPPAGAKPIKDADPEPKPISNPNIDTSDPNIPNPMPKPEKKADQKYSAWKNEFDLLSGLDKNIFRVFCQVLSEYRSCVGTPAYCEEAVTPEQIYIELRAGKWLAGVPSEFASKWLYLHTLNQLKSKPQSADTEFDDISRQMNGIAAKLGFVEKPDCIMVREKVKARIAKGFTKKDPIPEVLKQPIIVEQPLPKPNAPKKSQEKLISEEIPSPQAPTIFKQPSSKIPKVDSGPQQEVVDAIRHVKAAMKSGDIEDFAAYGRALQKMLEFIVGK